MGGVRAPQRAYRLEPSVESFEMPPQTITVEKIIEVNNPALIQQLETYKNLLKEEGKKVVELQERLSRLPKVPQVVEKLVERVKTVEKPVYIDKSVVVKEVLPVFKDKKAIVIVLCAFSLGLALGVFL